MYEIGSYGSRAGGDPEWQSTVSALHGAMAISTGDGAYRARVAWQTSDAFALVRWAGDAERLVRDRRHLREDPRETVELLVPLSGRLRLERGARSVVVAPGHMALVPMDGTLVCTHDDGCAALAFIAPRERVVCRVGAAGPQLGVLDGRRGLGRVTRTLLTTLREERGALTGAAFDAACDRLVDLLCLASSGAAEPGTATHREDVESAIRRHVREHAHDVSLDGLAVASALGWSLRYVQAVLRGSGTTMTALIREERLSLARARLAGSPHPVARIAADCGFRSHAAFATAFRARFGMTPSAARGSAS